MHCLVSKPVSAKVMAGVYRNVRRHGTAYDIGVPGDDGAVVAVVHFLVAFVLVDNVWQEDAFHLLVNQVLNVAVH